MTGRRQLTLRLLSGDGASGFSLEGDAIEPGSLGWYIDFVDAGATSERSLNGGTLVDGVLLFNTLLPGARACDAVASRTYALNALSGLPDRRVALVAGGIGDAAAVVGLLHAGYAAAPIALPLSRSMAGSDGAGRALQQKSFAIVSPGAGERLGAPLARAATSLPVGRLSWREVANWRELHQTIKNNGGDMQRQRAFTLLELVVAMAIIAILATAAYPDLHRHVIRTRRSEAQSVLQQLMQQQERFFSQNNTYIAFSADSTEARAKLFRWWTGNSQAGSAYEVEGKACDGELISQCLQLVATLGTARVDAQFRDPDCQQLTLTSSGGKRASGPAEHCWPRTGRYRAPGSRWSNWRWRWRWWRSWPVWRCRTWCR